jgi:hypothetical protein
MTDECRLCNLPAPRLYLLPPRVSQTRPGAGPACYFCFIRTTGIKPTRRQIVGSAIVGRTRATG